MLSQPYGRHLRRSRVMDSHLLVVPGVSISLEGSQDESGVVAWVGATTFSTLLGGGSMALDTSYGAVGRLRRFNSCIFPLPLFRLVSATSSTLSQRFSYGFSQVFPLGIGCPPACGLLQ